jgi:hypothetical protein
MATVRVRWTRRIPGTALISALSLVPWSVVPALGQCPPQEVAKLTLAPAEPIEFGQAIAMSGDTAVIGADVGAYVFVRSGGPAAPAWVQAAKLQPSYPSADGFGASVAIEGDTVVVGAYSDNEAGSGAGAAYVFVRPAGGWVDMTETAKLTASDAASGDRLGFRVAVSGDTVVATAVWDDTTAGVDAGSAYVFVKPAGGWTNLTETTKLTASDATPNAWFGYSLALSGDTAVVGARYRDSLAYVFYRAAGVWAEQTKLISDPASDVADSAALAGDTLVVGGGWTFVFARTWNDGLPSWTQMARLTPSWAEAGLFGRNVALDGDAVLVGADFDNDAGGTHAGAAYFFVKPASGWADMTETAKLTASDAAANDRFGSAVALAGDAALIGAYEDDNASGDDAGAAYAFDLRRHDSDGDGVADGCDGCPDDPNKTAPGDCGCGLPDTDSDRDSTPDCIDGCPNDGNKAAPGKCGCGVADTDSDGDETPDCSDECPDDPDKTAPGECGCGVADVDSDGDGAPDCEDECPDDPEKTARGACGCGVADVDSDHDGVLDCRDGCPKDPGKTAPGACGCRQPDIDSDGDGVLDCLDGCPDDPNKTAPGDCGCGQADIDSDGDGVLDCLDRCPGDPNKTAPGDCGCGQADADRDGDGVVDCLDNCPDVLNPDQLDSNGDGVGDACTNLVERRVPPCGGGACGGSAATMIGLTLIGLLRSRLGGRMR